jgi:transposase
MLAKDKKNLSAVKAVLYDGEYIGKPFSGSVMESIRAETQAVKRNGLHTFAVLPKRWIVERSFAWLEKCHRFWKNCEAKLHTSLQMLVFAFVPLLLKIEVYIKAETAS